MSDKKIATLTFHRAINYGAVFQAYALQRAIEKEGVSSEVIDYRNDFLERLHNPHDLSKYKTILHYAKAIAKNRVKRDNRKGFSEFRDKYIRISQQEYDQSSISDTQNKYDAIIVGSDQVWNLNCTKNDENYFLPFVKDKSKKYSYAASIAISLDSEELRDRYKRLTEDFAAISVREAQAQAELKTLGVDSVVSVDPTLLLDKNEWSQLAKQPSSIQIDEKYVLVYVIVETPTIFEKAKKIAKEKGLELVYINEGLVRKKGFKNLYKLSPEEWLWVFQNASYVVTNSFHGTAFSINLERSFIVEPLPVKTNANSRITDLLDSLGLQNRFISSNQNVVLEDVDYSTVDIDAIKKPSVDYLKSILNNIK